MYIPPEIRSAFIRQLAVLKLLWVVFLAAMGMLVVVAYMKAREAALEPFRPPPLGTEFFPLIGAIVGLIAFSVRLKLLSDDKIKQVMRSVSLIEQGLKALPQKLMRGHIICYALHEAVVAIGFVQCFLARELTPMWPYLGGAVLLHLLCYPKIEDIFETAVSSSRAF